MTVTPTASWVPCAHCDEYWCVTHEQHVFECLCPPIEAWTTDPYGYQNEGPARYETTRQTTEGEAAPREA